MQGAVDSIPLGGHVFEFALTANGRGYVPSGDSVLILDTRVRAVTGTFTRGESFYSIGVDPVSGDVYAGDARNYVQPGSVSVFSAGGAFIRSFGSISRRASPVALLASGFAVEKARKMSPEKCEPVVPVRARPRVTRRAIALH